MPEDLLEGEDVAAVADVGDGEGVPKAVGINVFYPGAAAEAFEVTSDVAAVVGVSISGGK